MRPPQGGMRWRTHLKKFLRKFKFLNLFFVQGFARTYRYPLTTGEWAGGGTRPKGFHEKRWEPRSYTPKFFVYYTRNNLLSANDFDFPALIGEQTIANSPILVKDHDPSTGWAPIVTRRNDQASIRHRFWLIYTAIPHLRTVGCWFPFPVVGVTHQVERKKYLRGGREENS